MTTRTLYVGGLSQNADAELLDSLFGKFGELTCTRIMRRAENGHCRGFGYVTFSSDDGAARARVALDGHTLDGLKIRVDLAL